MQSARLRLQRAASLLWVSIAYGLGPYLRALLRRSPREGDGPLRLREAIEELGVTYVKLGQYLAMRSDILPDVVARELNLLFENVPPMPFRDVRAVVESELGGRLEQFFVEFSDEPIAAASIAQVHRARTAGGDPVAVKVQRLGIERVFAADMRNMRVLTRLIDVLGLVRPSSATEVVDEFTHWTLREMDFRIEGATADRLRATALAYEHVPTIHWELTTSRLLTMELVEGISLAQLGELLRSGGLASVREEVPNLDVGEVLSRLVFASLHQLFGTGFFHGDPHPGNVILRPDNAIAFVDFGIFGSLEPYERRLLGSYIESLVAGQLTAAARSYARLLIPGPDTDRRAFHREALGVLGRWHEESQRAGSLVNEGALGKYSSAMFELVRKHGYRMDVGVLLAWRALFALDSTALRFNDYFDMQRTVRAFFEQNQPDLTERLLELATDRRRSVSGALLARLGPDQVARTLELTTAGDHAWPLPGWESPEVERAHDRDARLVAAATFALSLGVLAAAMPAESPVRPLAVATVVLGLGGLAGAGVKR